jgi:hypothetical protein
MRRPVAFEDQRLLRLDLTIDATEKLIQEQRARLERHSPVYQSSSQISLSALEDSLEALKQYRRVLSRKGWCPIEPAKPDVE